MVESNYSNFILNEISETGSIYWTGGMYSPQTSLWEWSAHNHPLPPWSPWDVGHPAASPNPLHRVIIAHWSRNSAFWRTVTYTEIYPYICEVDFQFFIVTFTTIALFQVQRTTVAVDCYQTNDLIIVLDSSGSIESHNYARALTFIERLATAFTVHGPSRIALIIFSYEAEVVIDITNSYTRAEISSAILNTPYTQGGTNTWLGIDLAIAQFNSSLRDVPLNMVVLTDGMSNNEGLTIAAAQRATTMGIRSFSVGITDNLNQEELRVIAGGMPNRIFTSETFDELIQLLTPLSLRVCTNN